MKIYTLEWPHHERMSGGGIHTKDGGGSNSSSFLWAKSSGPSQWHPLILHLLDVSVCADAILEREPESTRRRMGDILGLGWEGARPWLLALIACHDLGKACPGFQCKWSPAYELMARGGLSFPRYLGEPVNHAYVSQLELETYLKGLDWPEELAELAADSIGSHHGSRASPAALAYLAGNRKALGDATWMSARSGLFESVLETWRPGEPPAKESLSGPDFMLLAGLTSFADWIGSNAEWFSFGELGDCGALAEWVERRRGNAERALDAIGWSKRLPLCPETPVFARAFDLQPRPLQAAMIDLVRDVRGPSVILVEAPMGEGKTEAAFYAHLELQRRFGHRGLYVALPTKATGNAMFERTLRFLLRQDPKRSLDLQLLHGSAELNDAFQELLISGIHDEMKDGDVRAGEWFTNKKRALLSEYGVGTVDQAIMPILPVRHQFVRMWGLANRVVVFDEIHAYDAYTGTLLIHLIAWLRALGSSVILLSATLPPSIRRKIAAVAGCEDYDEDAPYPRITSYGAEGSRFTHFEADPARRREIRVIGISSELAEQKAILETRLSSGGRGLALLNTVLRAQRLYALFPDGISIERGGRRIGKRLADGTEVYLFHARFPADLRQGREAAALENFGPKGEQGGRKILIATQVAEQSLDLDFDLIITDLAPMDLILQRAGRLWRHDRSSRPLAEPLLFVAGLQGEEAPSFGDPVWWNAIYREDLLLKTWILLQKKKLLVLPEEIDGLVRAAYEDDVDAPPALQERLERAIIEAEGEALAFKSQADLTVIGFPDDASWNRSDRPTLYDEDEEGVHRTLMARTRLGEDSLLAIPIADDEEFDPTARPSLAEAKRWIVRAISVSRASLVRGLRGSGVPEGWRKSAIMRSCYPLILDSRGRWKRDASIRLDEELGLLYGTEEAT